MRFNIVPALFVRAPTAGSCWICQSTTAESREHKIKASDIRRTFGKTDLIVGSGHNENCFSGKTAQGPSSKHLKFRSTICGVCNSSVTQESDLAYDQFIRQLESEDQELGQWLDVFSTPRFCEGKRLESQIPLFRYFAKLLGCHLADMQAPIPIHLSRFVAKRTARNCIWLGIRKDPAYEKYSANIPDQKIRYAAHGGLVVITREPNYFPSRLYTTLSVGPIQFTIFFVLTKFQILEMRLRHPKFVELCAERARAEKVDPMSEEKAEQLGLTRTSSKEV